MAQQSLRVGIVGTGYIAEYHLAILKTIPEVEVTAVCDLNREKAQQTGKKWKIPGVYNAIDKLLAEQQLDAVHLLVPPSLHTRLAHGFVDAGVNVLIEKPMGLAASACQELLDKAENKNVKIGVNHNAVFHPSFQRLLADVGARQFGRVEHVNGVVNVPLRQLNSGQVEHWMFQEPANIIFEQAPHPFSQINQLVGAPVVVTTMPSGKRVLPGGRVFYDTWQISMECERGTASLFLAFGREFPESSLQVIGQDASAFVDLINNTYTTRRRTMYIDAVDVWCNEMRLAASRFSQGTRNLANYIFSTLQLKGRTDMFYVGMENSIKAFYSGLRAKMPAGVCGTDALKVVQACEMVKESLPAEARETRRKVEAQGASIAPADILVLGATGFIGSKLVERFVREKCKVRIMTRRCNSLPLKLQNLAIEIVEGDIADSEAVRRAIQGTKIIYHLATGSGQVWADFEKQFVQGLNQVADACLLENVKRLIFTSTIAVYYLGENHQPVTEETPLDSALMERAFYARAKILCERSLQEWRAKGLPVVIFRPGVVIGEGGITAHTGVGWWPNPTHCLAWGQGNNPLPFVLVDDVVEALAKARTAEGIDGQAFNLVGDVNWTADEYVAHLRELSGRNVKLHRRLLWQLQGVELFKWMIKAFARRPENPFPSFRDLKTRSLRSRFDCSRAKQVLGWTPVSDQKEFLEKGIHCS